MNAKMLFGIFGVISQFCVKRSNRTIERLFQAETKMTLGRWRSDPNAHPATPTS